MVEKAIQLNPAIPAWYLSTLATAYDLSGRQTEAVATYKRVFDRDLSHADKFNAHLSLAMLYVELGQEEDARTEAEEILKLVPNFSVEVWGQRNPHKDQAQIEQGIGWSAKSGIEVMLFREIFNPSPQNILFIPVLNNQTHRWGYLLLKPTYQAAEIVRYSNYICHKSNLNLSELSRTPIIVDQIPLIWV